MSSLRLSRSAVSLASGPELAPSPTSVPCASRASAPPEADAPTVWVSVSFGPLCEEGVGSQASEPGEAALAGSHAPRA